MVARVPVLHGEVGLAELGRAVAVLGEVTLVATRTTLGSPRKELNREGREKPHQKTARENTDLTADTNTAPAAPNRDRSGALVELHVCTTPSHRRTGWAGALPFPATEEHFQMRHPSLLPCSFYSSPHKHTEHRTGVCRYPVHSKGRFHIPESRRAVSVQQRHPLRAPSSPQRLSNTPHRPWANHSHTPPRHPPACSRSTGCCRFRQAWER